MNTTTRITFSLLLLAPGLAHTMDTGDSTFAITTRSASAPAAAPCGSPRAVTAAPASASTRHRLELHEIVPYIDRPGHIYVPKAPTSEQSLHVSSQPSSDGSQATSSRTLAAAAVPDGGVRQRAAGTAHGFRAAQARMAVAAAATPSSRSGTTLLLTDEQLAAAVAATVPALQVDAADASDSSAAPSSDATTPRIHVQVQPRSVGTTAATQQRIIEARHAAHAGTNVGVGGGSSSSTAPAAACCSSCSAAPAAVPNPTDSEIWWQNAPFYMRWASYVNPMNLWSTSTSATASSAAPATTTAPTTSPVGPEVSAAAATVTVPTERTVRTPAAALDPLT